MHHYPSPKKLKLGISRGRSFSEVQAQKQETELFFRGLFPLLTRLDFLLMMIEIDDQF